MCNYQKINRAETKKNRGKKLQSRRLTDWQTDWLTGKFGNSKPLGLRTPENCDGQQSRFACATTVARPAKATAETTIGGGTLNCHWHGGESRRMPKREFQSRRPETEDRRSVTGDWETPVAASSSSHRSWKAKGELLAQWLEIPRESL